MRSRTNATTVADAKITRERGWRVEKSVFASFFSFLFFVVDCPEDRDFVERERKIKKRFGASYSTSNKLLLVARHILTTGLQKCL